MIRLGVPNMSKNASTLIGLAPLAVLTHAGESDIDGLGLLRQQSIHRQTEEATHILFFADSNASTKEFPGSVMLLIPSSPSAILAILAAALQDEIGSSGVSVSQKCLTKENVSDLVGQSVISLLEVDEPLICKWTEGQFLAFKTLVSTVMHLF